MVSDMAHPGTGIRAMRQAQKLSLRQLADRAGVSSAYLSLVENELREPTQRWVRDVEEALAKHILEKGAA